MNKILMISVLLILATVCGCTARQSTADTAQPAPQIAVESFEECVAAGNPVMESYPRQCAADGQTFVEEINTYPDAPEVPAEEPVVEEPQEVCGNGVCEYNEHCDNCYKDCPCDDDEVCYQNECKWLECSRDRDCDDDDACTIDTCSFARHPNARCYNEEILECDNRDGCCPEDCNVDNDDDCGIICGDDICNGDEDADSCAKDCEEEIIE